MSSAADPVTLQRAPTKLPNGLDDRDLLDLAASQREWIVRRIEHIRFVDDRTVQRTIEMHVDLTATGVHQKIQGGDPEAMLLPLLWLDSSSHTAMTVRDESGRILTRLARDEERDLVATGILSRPGVDITACARSLSEVHRLIDKPSPAPESRSILQRAIRWLVRRIYVFLQVFLDDSNDNSLDQELDRLYESMTADNIAADTQTAIGLEVDNYRRGHLLAVCSPPEVLKRPMVFEISFSESFPPPLKRYALGRLVGGTLSLGAQIPMPGISGSKSFHATAYAPPGFRIVDLALRVDEEFDEGVETQRWIYDDDRLPMGGHAFASADEQAIRSTSCLFVNLYSNKTGFFFESLFVSIFTSALLAAFTVRFEDIGFELHSGSGNLSEDFAAGLILLFPALAVTIITQRDVHRLASRAFALQRMVLLFVAIAAAAASLPITLRLEPEAAEDWWYLATWVCWILSGRIVLASIRHGWRISSSRARVLDGRRRLAVLRARLQEQSS